MFVLLYDFFSFFLGVREVSIYSRNGLKSAGERGGGGVEAVAERGEGKLFEKRIFDMQRRKLRFTEEDVWRGEQSLQMLRLSFSI